MLKNIKIVLVETSHPGNIGAVARAMKTMGLKNLALVNPKQFPHEEAIAMASGADDVLYQAKIFNSLEEAIADCHLVLGATARSRDLQWPMYHPKQLKEQVAGKTTALVFGRERSGLTNEELWRCHAGIHIPTSPAYRSLNLSQAVQIVAYELWNAEYNVVPEQGNDLVTHSSMQYFYQHLEKVLIDIQFMKADEPKRLMPKLKRLFNRAQIRESEMSILRGILTQIDKLQS